MRTIPKRIPQAITILATILALGVGCGGAVSETVTVSEPVPSQAVLRLQVDGVLTGTSLISGMGVTVRLAEGVTVKKDAAGTVASGVVSASGVATNQATVIALYTDAGNASPAELHIVLSSTGDGLPVGEFATVKCIVAPQAHPASSDFGLRDFYPVATDGTTIPGLNASLSVSIP